VTVLICHPGTGTIIDASECYVLTVYDDDIDTETIESAMDRFYQMVSPEGTHLETLEGVLDPSLRKRM